MILLSANNIRKSFGAQEVLRDISLTLQDGQRLGLVGINGCGKSTLLRILAGMDTADEGGAQFVKNIKIGYMEQNGQLTASASVWEELESVFAHVFRMENKLRELEREMESSSGDSTAFARLANEYSRLTDAFEDAGGYAWRSSIAGMLTGLGFNKGQFDQPVEQLSGGERTRLFLARLLLSKPDLLLLDEPTNHLDLSALEWLETYLKAYSGAIIVVSHDRYFLDAVCTDIAEILFGKIEAYHGNYSSYQRQRAERFELRLRSYENQQKEIARQEAIIARYRMYNQEWSIRKAKTREHVLERMERLSKPRDEKTARFSFHARRRTGDDVLMIRGLSKAYGERTLFGGLDIHIRSGERVALIGPNGAGKTTLMDIITGRSEADEGFVRFGSNVDVGYYDQMQSGLHPEKTVLDEVWDRFPRKEQTEIRSALGLFLFTGDEVFKQIKTLSGGEKGRVALTILMLRLDNFLLLDEPTNHLDMDAREALENTLYDFEGTIFTISHDRYFINRIADRVLELSEDGVTEYLGNYDDYLEKKNRPPDVQESEPGVTRTELEKRRKRTRAEVEKLREKKQAVEALEEEINDIEKRITEQENLLASPEIYQNAKRAADAAKEHRRLTEMLGVKMDEWEEAAEDM